MTDLQTIRELEEVSLNAWPALRHVVRDGWVLRFADGYTRRSNCVNPLYPGGRDLGTKVRECEALYSAAGLPTTFKLTAASVPADLEAFLRARGYVENCGASVRVLNLTPRATGYDGAARAWDAVAGEWLDAYCAFGDVPGRHRAALAAIVGAIVPPHRLVAATEAGEIVACGLGVCQPPHLGLFDIVTRPDCRRRGFARRVVSDLLAWGRRGGATIAYLQVVADNLPATTLYESMGFREAYEYRYFAKP